MKTKKSTGLISLEIIDALSEISFFWVVGVEERQIGLV